jgi:uncharacterized protein (TIGR00251 family)
MAIRLTSSDGGVRLAIKVVPGASRDRIVGELGDALKIAVKKPPQDGAANRAVVQLIATGLGLPEANVTIVRGHGNPRKEVLVAGLTVAELAARLADAIAR